MHTRFAAVLLGLGLVDLVYVNLGPGANVLARRGPGEPQAPADGPGARVAEAPPASVTASLAPEREPSPGPAAPSRAEPPRAEPGAPRGEAASPASAPPAQAGASSAPGPAESSAAAVALGAPELPAAPLTVTFPDVAGAELTPEARAQLLALAEALKQQPDRRARVTGHADARGSQSFNRYLGARRARAVLELLASAGVPRAQIAWESRGEDEPRALGASEEVWAANRRVEIEIDSQGRETP